MDKDNKLIATREPETVLFKDACTIIEQAQESAYRQVNETLIKRNWLLGMRIQHEVLKDKRAEYGEQVVKNLGKSLTERYGKGFTWRNLYNFMDFYGKHTTLFFLSTEMPLSDQEILHAVSAKSSEVAIENILHAVSAKSENIFHIVVGESPIRLSWTHYRIILQESNKEAREWYEQEAAREMWGTRTLQRNVSSQYYHRLLQSQNKDAVRGEMKQLTAPFQDKLEYIKNPVVAEFLGFKNRTEYTESELEQTIIDHLIPFQ